VDLIVGEMEFSTSKIGKVEDPQTGGYILTAENEGYNLAKEERLRKENKLVHRVMHPLFDKNEEQLREHDSKVSKEREEQKKEDKRLNRVQYTSGNRRKR
jgi:carbamoylphosphate synthase small subunit